MTPQQFFNAVPYIAGYGAIIVCTILFCLIVRSEYKRDKRDYLRNRK